MVWISPRRWGTFLQARGPRSHPPAPKSATGYYSYSSVQPMAITLVYTLRRKRYTQKKGYRNSINTPGVLFLQIVPFFRGALFFSLIIMFIQILHDMVRDDIKSYGKIFIFSKLKIAPETPPHPLSLVQFFRSHKHVRFPYKYTCNVITSLAFLMRCCFKGHDIWTCK